MREGTQDFYQNTIKLTRTEESFGSDYLKNGEFDLTSHKG